ncbi:hypothetical protein [Micromonospora arborensis]|uniref:hypothetical protein n=1 Tax=Micromonospora arborensis TaxID=2116518 RepID=UPI001FC8FD51|nr:hypothetical protein [Micromonospora arborensis]
MIRDLAGAVAGDAGDQEQDVEEFVVGIDAERAIAVAGEAGMAVDAAEPEQGKGRAPNGPGRNDMRTRRHDPSEDLTEGMGKEPTATSATDARKEVRSKEQAASRGVKSSLDWVGEKDPVAR